MMQKIPAHIADESSLLNERLVFKIKVSKTNFFSIKFNYAEDINSKFYHFVIDNLKLTPHGEYESLSVGSSIVKNQSPSSFGVCNIGFALDKKQPRFDIELLINVPFFRKGHFFNLVNASTYKKNENSHLQVELITGTGTPAVIVNNLELINNQLTCLPITW